MTEPQIIPAEDQMQPADVTESKKPDWIYHATKARLALLITMHNEWECVVHTIKRVRERFAWIGIVRSYTPPIGTEGYPDSFAFLLENEVQVEYAGTLPDLAGQYSKFELPAQSICRNYSALFSAVAEVPNIDYCVAITGDTVLLHPYGIEEIVAAMEKKGAVLGCSKACGQEFHRADLTLEELEAGKGGGRKQGLHVPDFQPQLFAVDYQIVKRGAFCAIPVVNKWCSEQSLGSEVVSDTHPGDWSKVVHVFSETAYGWMDGTIYNAVTGQPGGEG